MVAKFPPNIDDSVEFVSAAWIVFTEASPAPLVAFVERVLIKRRSVPHGVLVKNVLPMLLVAEALAETAVVIFGKFVVALRPIGASFACSGRKKKAQFVTLLVEEP